uniref:Uncharacterized protein n=1 Tax=Timema genevievae TaxID=629358 RepID=A0A7R9JUW4_TIMGE|nr:unnamed protein product [Timema genevievae]
MIVPPAMQHSIDTQDRPLHSTTPPVFTAAHIPLAQHRDPYVQHDKTKLYKLEETSPETLTWTKIHHLSVNIHKTYALKRREKENHTGTYTDTFSSMRPSSLLYLCNLKPHHLEKGRSGHLCLSIVVMVAKDGEYIDLVVLNCRKLTLRPKIPPTPGAPALRPPARARAVPPPRVPLPWPVPFLSPMLLSKPGALNALSSLSALGGLTELLGGSHSSPVQTTGVHRSHKTYTPRLRSPGSGMGPQDNSKLKSERSKFAPY